MAPFNESLQQNDQIFQSYIKLVGPENSVPHIKSNSLDEVLLDHQRRLQLMALIFHRESHRLFRKETINAFEIYFINHIYTVIASRTLHRDHVKRHITNRQKMLENLIKAKQLFSEAQIFLNQIDNSRRDKAKLYQILENCTICFDNSLYYYIQQKSYKIFHPPLRNITLSECYIEVEGILEYFAKNGYHNIKNANIEAIEKKLRQYIILTVLEGEVDDISQKEGVLLHLRSAKRLLNLASDELGQEKTRKGGSERAVNFLKKCEVCFSEALNCWDGP